MREFLCTDCGFDTCKGKEYYMVTNELWNFARMKRGMLCIGCLEKRIGRELVPEDFPDYPINRGFFPFSKRLKNRIGDYDGLVT